MNGASSSTGPLGLGNLGAVALINDSTRGEWLVIWDVWIVALPNPILNQLIVADMAICTGILPGSSLIPNNNGPLTSATPVSPGTNWVHNGGGTELGNIFSSVDLIVSANTAYYKWLHDWPVCAIAPGDSVVAYSDGSTYYDFGVGYIYEVVPGGI